jgi:hypothetical protein
MGLTMDMHDDAFNFNSPLLIFARCGNNNLHNLQVESGEKQGLKDVNGDEAHLFEVCMEKLKTKEFLGSLTITICQHGFFSMTTNL